MLRHEVQHVALAIEAHSTGRCSSGLAQGVVRLAVIWQRGSPASAAATPVRSRRPPWGSTRSDSRRPPPVPNPRDIHRTIGLRARSCRPRRGGGPSPRGPRARPREQRRRPGRDVQVAPRARRSPAAVVERKQRAPSFADRRVLLEQAARVPIVHVQPAEALADFSTDAGRASALSNGQPVLFIPGLMSRYTSRATGRSAEASEASLLSRGPSVRPASTTSRAPATSSTITPTRLCPPPRRRRRSGTRAPPRCARASALCADNSRPPGGPSPRPLPPGRAGLAHVAHLKLDATVNKLFIIAST